MRVAPKRVRPSVFHWTKRQDVAELRFRCWRRVVLLSEGCPREGEPSHLLAKFLDLSLLVRDGLPELGDGLAKPFLGLRHLLGLVADAFVELVLQVRVPLHEGHAVDVSFDSQGGDGEAAVGDGGLSGQEAVHGLADADALVLVLLGHVRASMVWAVASWVAAVSRSRAELACNFRAMGPGACSASWSISSARSRSWRAWVSVRTVLPQPDLHSYCLGAVAPGSGSQSALSCLKAQIRNASGLS